MTRDFTFTAGLPHLDIHTLSEDWALASALESHWQLLAGSLGLKPSAWIDGRGDRMYNAVIALGTAFDLADPIGEDDAVRSSCEILALRKPHALSATTFAVDGREKARVTLLTSFIKRVSRASNKKFSRTGELWSAPDQDGDTVDDLIERHHRMKSVPEIDADAAGTHVARTEINRIRDFNTADFLYFKNFVGLAKAAEWARGRGAATRLNARRECWFYGNVEDGDMVETRVHEPEPGVLVSAHHAPDGRRIFLSRAEMAPVAIAER
jgi:probable biosynthetic protein (TIGR04098 family)